MIKSKLKFQINIMQKKHKLGFTLVELIVVISLFTTVMLISSGLYLRYSSAERKLRSENDLYEETRFTLERIVKEFREGTIDYEEYWNQANLANGDCVLYSSGTTIYEETYGNYGNCYTDYKNVFYDNNGLNTGQNPSNATNTTEQNEQNAVSTTGSLAYEQNELYIINNMGNKKTLLRCLSCDDNEENGLGKLQILKLRGYDDGYEDNATSTTITETLNDGIIDKWVCAKDFTCSGNLSDGQKTGEILANNDDGWTDYSSSSLDITDLKFYIAPLEDPRKAYNENNSSTQMQPHTTIIISAKLNKEKAKGLPGKIPTVTLQTTVSGRVFNEVK